MHYASAMDLFLMRHGEAGEAARDRDRALTEKGRADAARMARFLRAANVVVDGLWHSPYVRAAETAAIVGDVLGVAGDQRLDDDRFTPDASPHTGAQALFAARATYPRGLLLVAHLPILPGLVNALGGGLVSFSTAGCSHLKLMGGSAVLVGHYNPDYLPDALPRA